MGSVQRFVICNCCDYVYGSAYMWYIHDMYLVCMYVNTLIRVHPQGQGQKSSPALDRKKRCISKANFQFCQFFVVLHKIGHECIMTLHGHFTKITKKTKHGNVYNDRSTEKNNSQKHGFWTFARSLYKFPCFVFLVVL